MRDLERWKDNVELSLNGRQIFFLFFGSAVAACAIFVAGVLVGKRIEARGGGAPTVAEDPLALLDQLGAEEEGMTYHQALGKGEHKGRKVRIDSRALAATLPDPPVAAAPPVAPPTSPAPVVAPAPSPAPVPSAQRPAVRAVDPSPMPMPDVPPVVVRRTGDDRFTLQLSAFTEKGEAEEFARKVQASGWKPFLVQSEIPGRGVFYRVRVGEFNTRKSANEAKLELERKQHLVAYVARL